MRTLEHFNTRLTTLGRTCRDQSCFAREVSACGRRLSQFQTHCSKTLKVRAKLESESLSTLRARCEGILHTDRNVAVHIPARMPYLVVFEISRGPAWYRLLGSLRGPSPFSSRSGSCSSSSGRSMRSGGRGGHKNTNIRGERVAGGSVQAAGRVRAAGDVVVDGRVSTGALSDYNCRPRRHQTPPRRRHLGSPAG